MATYWDDSLFFNKRISCPFNRQHKVLPIEYFLHLSDCNHNSLYPIDFIFRFQEVFFKQLPRKYQRLILYYNRNKNNFFHVLKIF